MRTIQPADEGAPPGRVRLAGKVALPTIRLAAILGMLATAALLGVVSATAGLGVAGWIAGLATGSAATALLVTARMRSDQPAILPADWVTLTRTLLIAGVAGLVADSFGRPVSITALVTLSTVALALDAVDGQVARRTGTATPLGARIDGEVDAFLILLLSIAVSRDYGSWVLVIGAARYALLLAGWLIPWLAAPLPPRYWRKVVAAVQGIVLTVAASGVLEPPHRNDRGRRRVAAAGRVVRPRRDLAVPHRRRPAHPPGTAAGHHRACGRDSCGLTSSRPTVPGSSAPAPLSASPWKCWPWLLSRWCCRPGRDGSWPLSPESCFGLLTFVKILNMAFYGDGRSGVQPGDRLGRASARPWAWYATRSAPRSQTLCSSCSGSVSSCSSAQSPQQRFTSPPWPPGIAAARFAASLPSPRSGRCARACHCNSSRDPRSPRPAPPGWPSRRCAPPRQRSATSAFSSRPSAAPTPRPASPLRTC